MLKFLSVQCKLMLLAILSFNDAFSQAIVHAQPIEIAFNKTSSIVFATNITAVDRGSRDVLARKPKGINNVLQLKAGRTNFKETNLTVITADGKLHHFFIRYSDHPLSHTLEAPQSGLANIPAHFESEMTQTEMISYAERIASATSKALKRNVKFDMNLSLAGIYIRDNVMFYHLRLANRSNINYHPDPIRFYIKDKRRPTRTASQELTLEPIFIYGDQNLIKGMSRVDLIYAINKFTIPDKKNLHIEVLEKNGGRHLNLRVNNKMVVKASTIPGN